MKLPDKKPVGKVSTSGKIIIAIFGLALTFIIMLLQYLIEGKCL